MNDCFNKQPYYMCWDADEKLATLKVFNYNQLVNSPHIKKSVIGGGRNAFFSLRIPQCIRRYYDAGTVKAKKAGKSTWGSFFDSISTIEDYRMCNSMIGSCRLRLLTQTQNRFSTVQFTNILYSVERLVRIQVANISKALFGLRRGGVYHSSRSGSQMLILKELKERLNRIRSIVRRMVITRNLEDYRLFNEEVMLLRMFLLPLNQAISPILKRIIRACLSVIKRISLAVLNFELRS